MQNAFPGKAQQGGTFHTGEQFVDVGQELEVRAGIYDRYRVTAGQALGAGETGEVSADNDDPITRLLSEQSVFPIKSKSVELLKGTDESF